MKLVLAVSALLFVVGVGVAHRPIIQLDPVDDTPPIIAPILKVFDATNPPLQQCEDGLMLGLLAALGIGPHAEPGCLGCPESAGQPAAGSRRRLAELEKSLKLGRGSPMGDFTLMSRAVQAVVAHGLRHQIVKYAIGMALKNSTLSTDAFRNAAAHYLMNLRDDSFHQLLNQASPSRALHAEDEIVVGADEIVVGADEIVVGADEIVVGTSPMITEPANSNATMEDEPSTEKRGLEDITVTFEDVIYSVIPDSIIMPLTAHTTAFIFDGLISDLQYGISQQGLSISASLTAQAGSENIGTVMCKSLGYGARADEVQYQCDVINLLTPIFACRSTTWDNSVCNETLLDLPAETVYTCGTEAAAANKLHFRNLLKDGKSTPQTIDPSVIDEEGLGYYYLFKAVNIFYRHSWLDFPCSRLHSNPINLLEGWTTKLQLVTRQEGDNIFEAAGVVGVPTALIAQSDDDPCDIMIVLRGTASFLEWILNFKYWMVGMPGFPDLKAHAGFVSMVAALIPGIEDFLAGVYDACPKPSIVVTGHSLGSGLGAVLSLYLGMKLEGQADVTAVLFAPPNSLDAKAQEELLRVVNVRSILFDLDPIIQIPCSVGYSDLGMLKCNATDGFIPQGDGWEPYVAYGGQVLITAADVDDPIYAVTDLADIDLTIRLPSFEISLEGSISIPGTLQIGSAHMCAYACWLSQFCGSEEQWMCGDNCEYTLTDMNFGVE